MDSLVNRHIQWLALVVLIGVSSVRAGSRYIAIPINEIDVIELNPIAQAMPAIPGIQHPARIARQAETYVPVSISAIHRTEEVEAGPPRFERSPSQILDYVDFGAHTGANGAFGWYADYPTRH
ncbi:uncharacterized protein LOC105703817 [Orussus abietinus]|uniref:uncharacterized protein LOC105703817 n=1 Tax=Orussus abietinus TaxID=222816 RepID=UPI000C715AF0|nr:uncharacterized protein LOC105703817 [Orussus abietinus]